MSFYEVFSDVLTQKEIRTYHKFMNKIKASQHENLSSKNLNLQRGTRSKEEIIKIIQKMQEKLEKLETQNNFSPNMPNASLF